ncbi:ribonuclease III [Congregibacter brevis]|uniref:Ribonuclease 3 n=1 Tax=Congregibacter brevis TaxID=3081201 RepID=A0ABZ0ICI6_9GAMM|nr:ribonuclease III [Congregibacter sp. IMCC45268]
MDDQQWLERQFGCRLHQESLLAQALSHRSVGSRNNERLEFLGDSVLGYIVSEELYRRFPDADEGQLSRLRVSLVKGSALAEVARELSLGEQLRLGSGERHGGGRRRDSILADSFEAVLGAITLDSGIEACRQAIFKVFRSRLDGLRLEQARKDPKTRLQELLQGSGRPLPDYVLRNAAGEDHARIFTVACELADGKVIAEGVGDSRRAAEQAAAAAVLDQLGES